ncbi:hypothetical protein BHF68_07025 [Desulfuribacillus alkaliarsenatis]|uniref:DUF86 domain-containing protein n=2 Tax=Desulfuribacillus alkaliarsenatis TaxID=766136 RepID=A0A1E5G1V0_9FIRM|nr:hypothetical protein BHF68_07025 [Desulfuribacillus alkaliarsenatis]
MLTKKIADLQKNILLLEQIKAEISIDNLHEDEVKYWAIERGLQLSVEIVIDIANILISANDWETPDTYRETLLKLGEKEIVPKAFAEKISGMAHFRNILVHDYLEMDENILKEVLTVGIADIVKYIDYVNRYLKS